MKFKKLLRNDLKISAMLMIVSIFMSILEKLFHLIKGGKNKSIKTTKFVLFVNRIMNKLSVKFTELENQISYAVRKNL